ncbi:MAG: NADP-dependent malic enzyme [Pseudomonadota bacterium]
MAEDLERQALDYHEQDPPGKLQIVATKPMATQHDLSLAYSPGVAAACDAIAQDPANASRFTTRGNLVAVVSNGTAVLGLGNIGALASKPVMEGKAVLFKKFSGINVFDLEVNETDVDRFCDAIAVLEPTFGGINLEDIKAPECFEIEKRLRERMDIPVFHDDQHGTAIVVSAAVLNGLDLVGKEIGDIRIVCCGAGAAALACLDLLISFGAKRDNIIVSDICGVVYKGRTEEMDPYKAAFANDTEHRTLAEALVGADLFLGLSAGRIVSAEMVAGMAENPIILAMANPEPEIRPELVRTVRSDAIIATGRSDYPNQVNNVLCFPFIFRGALDVGATDINEEMKMACARAIAKIARAEASDVVLSAYDVDKMAFGADYIIPKPFDPRLILEIAPAVARAAMDSGVASRPIEDLDVYRATLSRFVFRSGMLMKPVFDRARRDPKRVVYAEGETERVLQAAQQSLDAGIAHPVLVGSADYIARRIRELGLRLEIGKTVDVVDPADVDGTGYCEALHELVGREGIPPTEARRSLRSDQTVYALMMLQQGDADAAICGVNGRFAHHLRILNSVIGKAPGVRDLSTMSALVLPAGTIFVADTYVSPDPSDEEIAELAILSARTMQRMGVEPKIALVSHSNFGDRDSASGRKMRRATKMMKDRAPDLEVDGEMHADAALSESLRGRAYQHSSLAGEANLLIMPNIDAAHISLNLLKRLGGGVSVGPIMLGAARPAHIASQSITVRGLLNMTAIAVLDAQGAI